MSDAEARFPFTRELKEQHDALWAAVRWFRSELERPDGPGRVDGLALLRVFREQLAQHFRFEEQDGFQEGAHDPEVRGWTRELVRQHRAFEQRLDALVARLEASENGRTIPAARIVELDALFADLRRHDVEENALLAWIARRLSSRARDVEGP